MVRPPKQGTFHGIFCTVFPVFVGPTNLHKYVRDFYCIILEDFAGDFPAIFFWALCPIKLRKSSDEIHEKISVSKVNIREESVLPRSGPNFGV